MSAAQQIAAATGGFCPRRHHGHTTEHVGGELIIYPHEPVLDSFDERPATVVTGQPHIYVCRHCRAVYTTEAWHEYVAREERELATIPRGPS